MSLCRIARATASARLRGQKRDLTEALQQSPLRHNTASAVEYVAQRLDLYTATSVDHVSTGSTMAHMRGGSSDGGRSSDEGGSSGNRMERTTIAPGGNDRSGVIAAAWIGGVFAVAVALLYIFLPHIFGNGGSSSPAASTQTLSPSVRSTPIAAARTSGSPTPSSRRMNLSLANGQFELWFDVETGRINYEEQFPGADLLVQAGKLVAGDSGTIYRQPDSKPASVARCEILIEVNSYPTGEIDIADLRPSQVLCIKTDQDRVAAITVLNKTRSIFDNPLRIQILI